MFSFLLVVLYKTILRVASRLFTDGRVCLFLNTALIFDDGATSRANSGCYQQRQIEKKTNFDPGRSTQKQNGGKEIEATIQEKEATQLCWANDTSIRVK